jgi:hypothetical protein
MARNDSTPEPDERQDPAHVLTSDLRPCYRCRGQAQQEAALRVHNFRDELASWLVNQGTDVKTMQGPAPPGERFHDTGALRAPGECFDDGGAGVRHASDSIRHANGPVRVMWRLEKEAVRV